MIDVVVPVLAVPADAEQVRDGIEPLTQRIHLLVGIEIGGIRLLHALHMVVQDIFPRIDEVQFDHLGDAELCKLVIRHAPEGVSLVAEILQSHPDGVLQVLHKVRRPVVVNLEPAHLHRAVLYVDPVVRNDVADRLHRGLVLQVQVIDEDADRHVIAVGKTRRNACRLRRHVIHPGHKVPDRHGRDDDVTVHLLRPPGCLIRDADDGAVRAPADSGYPRVRQDRSALLADPVRRDIPQLARTQLRIGELLDEGGLDLAVFPAELLLDRVLQHRKDGHTLDALGAPGRIDLGGMPAPEVFRVIFEEHGIQLAAEPVDIEILE